MQIFFLFVVWTLQEVFDCKEVFEGKGWVTGAGTDSLWEYFVILSSVSRGFPGVPRIMQ